jgi:glycosyltransferase involved in cell wall biosynthesis
MNPKKFIEDNESYEIFDKFIKEQGPFDVIHFNNIEGISINVLKLKEKYPNTKFIVSIHNYQPICPLVQYFQNHNTCICNDFNNGKECLFCSNSKPNKKEYYNRCKSYYYDLFKGKYEFLRFPFKLLSKLFKYRSKNYIGSVKAMKPEDYVNYRKHNIEILNKYADLVLAVSERVREIMINNGILPNKIITSYIGTKFAENELGYSIAQSTKPFTIAYLGYKRIDKGFFFLIDALSKLDKEIASRINIVFAVAKLKRKNVEEILNNFNKVTIHNGYKHSELQSILNEVNLGVVPVLWEDNLPQVAIEMVACGVPILCSSFGGASELCNSELFKFKGASEEDFRYKLMNLVNNPKLLDEYWNNHSGLTTMVKHLEELIKIYGGNHT